MVLATPTAPVVGKERGKLRCLPLAFKAHRLVYHSTLGWRVIKNKKKKQLPLQLLLLTEVKVGWGAVICGPRQIPA